VSTAPAPLLSELEHDALTELINIGVSRAASSLRNMVTRPVLLSVPTIAIVSRGQAAAIIGERAGARLIAVHQAFDGDLSGRALLIFPEANSLELVRAVTGGELSLEDVIELEQEALAETGNIILNACLATIANMLRRSLRMSLPEILRGDGPGLFDASSVEAPQFGVMHCRADGPGGRDAVLFLYINFSVEQCEIRGYIAMLMDLPALTSLRGLLAEFIQRIAGNEHRHIGNAAHGDHVKH
jgi:chemotaxis protein CheC